jgi:RNA polymerase primary sigma factor
MSNEDLIKLIKQGINATEYIEKLYQNNKKFIYKIANKYKGYAELNDLKQEGFLGLYNAIEPYDETQGVLFMTYAGYYIQQAIGRYIENNCKSVRMPSHLYNQIHKYNRVINAFNSEFGRKPTDKELCKALKIDFKALDNLKSAIHRFNQLESLDSPIPGSDNEDLTVGDCVSDNSNIGDTVIDSMMDNRIQKELWQIVKDNTTEEENQVISARYKDNLTLEATGQIIGKTRDMVRNIESNALRKLRRPRITKEIKERFEINQARVYRSSWTMFNNDWTSITERVALKNIEIENSLMTKK